MNECYDEWWLPKDMERMGYMFEYCDTECLNRYNTKIDKIKLMTAFMNSDFRELMEQGHPKFLSQASTDSLKQWIQTDYNNDIEEFVTKKDLEFEHNQMYWVGWIYAYIHFASKLPSKELVKALPIETMIEQYYTGHEVSKENYYDKIKDIITTS